MSSSSSAPPDLPTYISTNLARNKQAGLLTDIGLAIFHGKIATNIQERLPVDLGNLGGSIVSEVRELVRVSRIKELLQYYGFKETSSNVFRFSGSILPAQALERISRVSALYQTWSGVPGVSYATAPNTATASAAAAANVLAEVNSGNGSELRRREKEKGIFSSFLTPVTEEDAGGEGNCFYFSLFEALRAQSLLDTVCDTFRLGACTTKDEFNRAFRKFLASELVAELDSIVAHICTIPIHLRGPSLSSLSIEYQTILESITEAQCKNRESRQPIVQQLQAITATNEAWAGEPEVLHTKRLLQGLGIILHIDNDEGYYTPDATAAFVYAPNRIILRRVGDNHYRWYRFVFTRGGERTKKRQRTQRTVKKQRDTRRL